MTLSKTRFFDALVHELIGQHDCKRATLGCGLFPSDQQLYFRDLPKRGMKMSKLSVTTWEELEQTATYAEHRALIAWLFARLTIDEQEGILVDLTDTAYQNRLVELRFRGK